jgi:ATP-dependent Clp protease ATP-binding subunit ClpC
VVGNCSHETTRYGKSTKRVLAAPSRFSDMMGHAEVDTDHIILGLLDESDGGAAKLWRHFGVDTLKTAEAIVRRIADEKLSSA